MQKPGHKEKLIIIKPKEANRDLSHLHFEEGYIFPRETIEALTGFCEILKGIRSRLLKEGYSIIEGKLVSSEGEVLYEREHNNKT